MCKNLEMREIKPLIHTLWGRPHKPGITETELMDFSDGTDAPTMAAACPATNGEIGGLDWLL